MRDQLAQQLMMAGIQPEQFHAMSSAEGMRKAMQDPRIRQLIEMLLRSYLGGWGGLVDGSSLVKEMERAEAEGRTGQFSKGRAVTAFDRVLGDFAVQGLGTLGKSVGVKFDTNVAFEWQPADSQRLIQWAARFGLQEVLISALSRMHFEERRSATCRDTLVAAAEEAGLDRTATLRFLDSRELEQEVWRSYGDCPRRLGIHSIPMLIFNGPTTNGGPFRDGTETAEIARGSCDMETFLGIFERILQKTRDAQRPKVSLAAEKKITERTEKTTKKIERTVEKTAKAGFKKGFLL
eukprot:gnl/MRDRNA2_/MRDRNA2_16328_c0_seq1.p1 gnl/MRDRNA2_/MRDRNA2_16328_c0~~gnl/MRDRNA2_/MRDRNA2_16328_c0_seq1.p1  ORF type:complete len:293 (+),score=61.55 gnl/MRDRNA2_/MRDRNA2_16328_c0_seq1:360-1238(+)